MTRPVNEIASPLLESTFDMETLPSGLITQPTAPAGQDPTTTGASDEHGSVA